MPEQVSHLQRKQRGWRDRHDTPSFPDSMYDARSLCGRVICEHHRRWGCRGWGWGCVEQAGWSKTPNQSMESCLHCGNKSAGVNNLVHAEEEIVMIKHDRYKTLGETTLWAVRKGGGEYPGAACCPDVKAFLPPCGLWQEPAPLAGDLVVLLSPRPQ